MKGIIFTEMIEMVESVFSIEVMEQVFDECELESGGVYTSVGTYPYEDLLQIVTKLSELTKTPVNNLVMAYGDYLFGRFTQLYPQMFEGVTCPLEFLESVEGHIHVEVLKLYTDARLPTLEVERITPDSLRIAYVSPRPLAAVAHALIQGCLKHFGNRYSVERMKADEAGGGETRAEFVVTPLETV